MWGNSRPTQRPPIARKRDWACADSRNNEHLLAAGYIVSLRWSAFRRPQHTAKTSETKGTKLLPTNVIVDNISVVSKMNADRDLAGTDETRV